MRKLTLLLLLATAAAPAMGQDRDGGRRQHRNDNAEQSENRPQREGRRSETRSGGGDQPGAFERVREHRERRVQTVTTTAPSTVTTESGGEDVARVRRGDGDTVRVRRAGSGDDGATSTGQPTNWRERERRIRTIPDTRPTVTRPVQVEREGIQTRNRRDYRDGNYRRWTRDWHRDSRYDWRRWRDRNRSTFRLGFYYDPFGWNYRRWSLGSFLYPSYYGSRYWLNDPWHYRLPPAYGPYRWVRYWNDALLVNIYTGEVVDVMHNFFW